MHVQQLYDNDNHYFHVKPSIDLSCFIETHTLDINNQQYPVDIDCVPYLDPTSPLLKYRCPTLEEELYLALILWSSNEAITMT